MAHHLQKSAATGHLLKTDTGHLAKICDDCCDCPNDGPTVTFTGIAACEAGNQEDADILNGHGAFQLVPTVPVLGDCYYAWAGLVDGETVLIGLSCNQSTDPEVTGWRLIGRVNGLDYFRADPDLETEINCSGITTPAGYSCPYANLGGEDGTATVEW